MRSSNLRQITLTLLLALLLASCASGPRAGLLTGKLVNASGNIPDTEYSIVLCEVVPDSNNCELLTKYQTVTVNGEFTIKHAPAGTYTIMIASEETGQGMFLMRGDTGNTLVVLLEEGKDFDMGVVILK